jgi:pimeloyl-ACP methyl ester carboxylesterase
MAVSIPAPNPIPVTTADGCALELRHHRGSGRSVLLVHGASAASDTFRIGETETLVGHLVGKTFDVWTLDWRASMRRVRDIYCRNRSTDFSIDAAATHDLPAAIAVMRQQGVTGKIGLVGHCMGGAIVTQGIAQGVLSAGDVESVVVTALGLFYRAAIDNVVKAEDGVLEDLLFKQHQDLLHPTKMWDRNLCQQDPGDGDWDPLLQGPYEVWRQTPLRHACNIPFCHRVSYMFGMPYLPDNIPTIHGATPTSSRLASQFGYIPVQFLLHCCQNLRRGYAAPFVLQGRARSLASQDTYLKREAFVDRKLTLITGDLNSLWHRDSIDTMYEWLLRGRRSEQPPQVDKHVLAGYGHQDLHWGTKAPTEVFPLIVKGL